MRHPTGSRIFVILAEGHADGERMHLREMTAAIYREMLAVDPRLQRAIHGFQKIVAVRLNMEADQVRAQQAIQQLALPGADAEGLRIRPGDVPEDSDPGIRPRFLDHAGHQGEVIILHQYGGILFVRRLLDKSVGKAPVDLVVGFPILLAKDGTRMRDVA